jgi:hypothetical protein
MRVGRISENPVLVGSDYKRACLFFDDVVPVIWPSAETDEDLSLFLHHYGEYRDALGAPFLKEHLLGSDWRGWVEGYAHLALGRLVFLKIRNDHPEANISLLAERALEYLKYEMRDVDRAYLDIFFPDADTFRRRVVTNPLQSVVDGLGENHITVDIYGHPGLEDTDDSVDVMLANIDVVQTENLTWDQIGAIREDVSAIRDLRQLRRFMLREMRGFTKTHVEDELMGAIEDHKKAAKKWGLTALPSSIKVDCEGSIVAGILTALGVAVTGAPLPWVAAIGTIAPLAQALFSISKGRKAVIRNSNVRYLVHLQDEAGKSQ